MAQPLVYSSLPAKQSILRRIGAKPLITLLLIGSLVGFVAIHGDVRTSADIRLDTGDLRYRYFGIPLHYQRMPEPQRSQLLALASHSSILTSDWNTCAVFPLRTTNNTDAMCRGWYWDASAWAAQDPRLAQLLLEDVAVYLKATNARSGLPASARLLFTSFVQPNGQGSLTIVPGWQTDPDVLAYMASKNYTPVQSNVLGGQ